MRIYIFSPIPYSFLHQRPQKLADQFVALSIPVTFIEPCGLTEYLAGRKRGLVRLFVRSVRYQCLGLLAMALPFMGRKPRPRGEEAGEGDALRIVAMPIIIPNNRVNSALLERLNAAIYRQALRHQVFRRMGKDEHSVAIVENPFWGLVLRKGDFNRIAYDCIDEITLFAGRGSADRFESYERDLVAIADATFVTAEKLEDNLRAKYSPTILRRVPNGVDYEYFQARAAEHIQPAEMARLKKPTAGYVGVLRDWLDYDLIGYLAARMPDVSFVMVGPLDFDFRIEKLKGLPNVHWPGRKDYREMPLYISAFDVCLIPFLVGKISRTTNPVKIFEYFALGKPVVSTPLYELEQFKKDRLLWIAETKEQFASALREALAESGAAAGDRRRAVARSHSWKSLAEIMLMTLGRRQGALPS